MKRAQNVYLHVKLIERCRRTAFSYTLINDFLNMKTWNEVAIIDDDFFPKPQLTTKTTSFSSNIEAMTI